MKIQRLFILLFLLLTVGVYAQQSLSVEYQYPDNSKAKQEFRSASDAQFDKQSSALRTTWIAQTPGTNWFIGLEGGISNYFAERWEDIPYDKTIRPTFGINAGKWFNPIWGLRLNISSAKLTEHDPTAADGYWDLGKQYPASLYGDYIVWNNNSTLPKSPNLNVPLVIEERFLTQRDDRWFADFAYIATTVDLIINMKHLFLPYNPSARFNPVIFGGIGFGHTFGSKFDPWASINEGQDVRAVNNVVGRLGLQLNYTIAEPVSICLNLEGMVVPENFERYIGGKRPIEGLANLTLGLSYKLGFKHSIKAPFYDYEEVERLNETINELRTRLENTPECPICEDCPEVLAVSVLESTQAIVLDPVFFTIDSYVVRDSQYIKILKAANYLIDNPEAKLILASYADVKTGNPPHNWTLSNNRSKAVTKVLMNKFGIAKDRLIIRFYGDTIQPFEVNELNRATIFIQEQ